jgi:hypothetical protein
MSSKRFHGVTSTATTIKAPDTTQRMRQATCPETAKTDNA